MHFHSMTYMATPEHKNSCPRGHEIYNFGRPFLGHHLTNKIPFLDVYGDINLVVT